MLSILGNQTGGYCDGFSRRDALKVGALGMGGLALPEFLRAEDAAGGDRAGGAVIMVFLAGGPPHLDMYDIKEDAPSEIRGEFAATSTCVPGIRVCEHMPRLAANMDKFAILRSVVGSTGQHSSFQCETGHSHRNQPAGGWPAFGSVLSRIHGAKHDGVPPFVGVSKPRTGGGFLGAGHDAFLPSGKGRSDMTLTGRMSVERVGGRKQLLKDVDKIRRDIDASGMMDGVDDYTQRAFEVITSSALVKALDLKNEDPKNVERYLRSGVRDAKRYEGTMRNFLTARRLVEAGARCITLNIGGWDTHGQNFVKMRTLLPALDHAVNCLVDDLHERGMERDVSVVVWGEFGRTPKVNKNAGRDHWPKVMSALLAGGGMRTGQVIGSTDRGGGEADDRPVHVAEVFSTLYHNCGIDAAKLTFLDHTGRPQYMVDGQRGPIAELV